MSAKLRDQLIGAWKLVSYEEKPVDGSASSFPMGEKPMGIIMYTPDGYMSAQLRARQQITYPFVPASPRMIDRVSPARRYGLWDTAQVQQALVADE
jgi:hypothetical protein